MNRYVFLDRDGTLIVDQGYSAQPADVELLPAVCDGLSVLQDLGFGLVVVTNQSAIGRQLATTDQVDAVNDRLTSLLAEQGIRVKSICVCPHAPEEHCSCRKPAPGLIDQAITHSSVRPEDCFVIGDKPCDVELAHAVGATAVLVRTGEGAITERLQTCAPDFTADDLLVAAMWIERCCVPLSTH